MKTEAAERPSIVCPDRHLSPNGLDVRGNTTRLSRVGVEVAVRADVGAKGDVDIDAELVFHLRRGAEEPVPLDRTRCA